MRMWDAEILCFSYLSFFSSLCLIFSLTPRACARVFDFVAIAAAIRGPTLPSTVPNWTLKLKCDEKSRVEPLYWLLLILKLMSMFT